MKLNSKKLKQLIIEVLQEDNGTVPPGPSPGAPATPSSLAGGAGVHQSTLKRGLRQSGEEIADIEEFTPQEGKIITRYMNLLQLASTELNVSQGPVFNYLNIAYKKLAQIVQQEMVKKDSKPNTQPNTN